MTNKSDLCQFTMGEGICGHDLSDHRPYAYKRDGVPSSSGVSGLIDGGKAMNFAWVAATIGARYAIHSPERLAELSTLDCDHDQRKYCERCAFLRGRFDAEWTAKADLGTHVHHIALSCAKGEEHDEGKVEKPYVDALYAFYEDAKPEWEHFERTVEYDVPGLEYRGQFDAIGLITMDGERKRVLVDYKTGSPHFPEMSMQLTSYRYATSMTVWENKKVVAREPMPEVDTVAALMLRDDGTYRLIELPSGEAEFNRFLNLRDLSVWHKAMQKVQREWDKAEKASATEVAA